MYRTVLEFHAPSGAGLEHHHCRQLLRESESESDSLQIERKEEVAVTTKLVRLYISLALN